MCEIAVRIQIISIDINLEAISCPGLILIGDVREGCVRQPIAEAAVNSTRFFSIGDIKNAINKGMRTTETPCQILKKILINLP